MTPLRGTSEAGTSILRDLCYLHELERQAEIFRSRFKDARDAALSSGPLEELLVWAQLQSALFAAIIVQRILKPVGVRKYNHHESKRQSQAFADARADRLRGILRIAADSHLFLSKEVRDSFEHVDERLDCLMRDEVAAVADCSISDGLALATVGGSAKDPGGANFRVFYARAGLLLFDSQVLDLFALDVAMLDLQRQIIAGKNVLEEAFEGRAAFKGKVVRLLDEDAVARRILEWEDWVRT